MSRSSDSRPVTLKTVHDDLVRLCRAIESVERDTSAIRKKLKIDDRDPTYDPHLHDWSVAPWVRDDTDLRVVAAIARLARAHMNDHIFYDLNAIRSKLDELLRGDTSRDEFQRYIKD